MICLIFFLEEPSAEAMLKLFLPKILPKNVNFRCHVFEGKQDLDKQVGNKLIHYNGSPNEILKFIILRDQDLGDCIEIKNKLAKITSDVGKPNTLVRIACRELESWYLADLSAVGRALELKNIHAQQNKHRFPDSLNFPSSHLKKLTNGRYQKIEGSRLIGQYLDPKNTRSTSFKNFVNGVMLKVNEK